MAHATDPIGPAHVNSGAVVATASAPYATATEQTGDTTTVVSASYVKGAYNDAIAAVNRVNSDKQKKIVNMKGEDMSGEAFSSSGFVENLAPLSNNSDAERLFVSAAAVAAGIKSQRVTAVDTWGSPHTVDVAFKTVQ